MKHSNICKPTPTVPPSQHNRHASPSGHPSGITTPHPICPCFATNTFRALTPHAHPIHNILLACIRMTHDRCIQRVYPHHPKSSTTTSNRRCVLRRVALIFLRFHQAWEKPRDKELGGRHARSHDTGVEFGDRPHARESSFPWGVLAHTAGGGGTGRELTGGVHALQGRPVHAESYCTDSGNPLVPTCQY